MLKHLPPESAFMSAQREYAIHWSLTDHLVDDVRMMVEASIPSDKRRRPQPHPQRPRPRQRRPRGPEWERKVADFRRRNQQRRKELGIE